MASRLRKLRAGRYDVSVEKFHNGDHTYVRMLHFQLACQLVRRSDKGDLLLRLHNPLEHCNLRRIGCKLIFIH